MQFNGTLYPYQSEILSIFEKERARGDKKIHIVAPPGSGKTIVGLEMMTRLDAPTLIVVPNLTLQEQWKDKIEKLFLESYESSEVLISTNISEIKKINIVTYQSLSGSDIPDDDINSKILDIWFQSEKDEFKEKETFLLFVAELKIENPDEYRELYSKHRKKLKESGDSEYTHKLIKGTIHEYVENLRSAGVGLMIVDEAHHLTSWWSHVLYEIWNNLEQPYIVGLTATPPFESVDYFELDESYTKLLGTVDYYVPTPAIVKSGRLAPYSDLLYIVPPDENLSVLLDEKEKKLQEFILIHKIEICEFLHQFLVENFARLEVKSLDVMEKWMRFIYVHKADTTIDMSSYITANASKPLTLEDIAKSIGKWGADGFKKTKKNTFLDEIKSLFFDLGYIWRGANLYRFQTPIEKGLIYSKSKINGVNTILEKEKENLGNELRVAVITDFLDVESDWINGHCIFDELAQSQSSLNPYLVSGQGIWKIENGIKTQVDESILSVTEKLTKGETKLVIGTRGILGEGWDCPAVNTLIDLTGVSAYMSVNQVHGRAIRLDPHNPDKVANVYDIICLGNGYQGMRDFERLEKKHAQFYGVDDSGLIIKELDHIYPQLERMIANPDKINSYTIRKSSLRSMVGDLWGIGGEYKNEEIFSLSIEILKPYEIVPLPSKLSWWQLIKIKPKEWKDENILELGKSSYHLLVRTWIRDLLDATLQVMKPYDLIPEDFSYEMKWSDIGSITISSNYRDPLVSKKFIETVSSMLGPITEEKYILKQEGNKNIINEKKGTPEKVILFIVFFVVMPTFLYIIINTILIFEINSILAIISILITIGVVFILIKKKNQFTETKTILGNNSLNTSIGIPNIISSNEDKRKWFIGKEYGAIPERARWYHWFSRIIVSTKGFLILIIISCVLLVVSGIIFGGKEFFQIINEPIEVIIIFFFSFLCASGIGIICYIIHIFYEIYAKIYNFIKRRKVTFPTGSIEPTTQSDIGKPSFLSAKIEKLWI